MSDVHYKKHRVFRETEDVIFYDISVEESNASDLVVHTGPATSPPDDSVGAKQFYIHSFQDDYNRVVAGQVFTEEVRAVDYQEARQVALARNPNDTVVSVTAVF